MSVMRTAHNADPPFGHAGFSATASFFCPLQAPTWRLRQGWLRVNRYLDKLYQPRSAFPSRPLSPLLAQSAFVATVPSDFKFARAEAIVARAVFALNRTEGAELIDAVRTPSFAFQTRDQLHLILDTVGCPGLEVLDLTSAVRKFDPACRVISKHKIECIVRNDMAQSMRCAKKSSLNFF